MKKSYKARASQVMRALPEDYKHDLLDVILQYDILPSYVDVGVSYREPTHKDEVKILEFFFVDKTPRLPCDDSPLKYKKFVTMLLPHQTPDLESIAQDLQNYIINRERIAWRSIGRGKVTLFNNKEKE